MKSNLKETKCSLKVFCEASKNVHNTKYFSNKALASNLKYIRKRIKINDTLKVYA